MYAPLPAPSSTTLHLSLWTWMSSCLKSSPVSLVFVSSRFPLLFCLPVDSYVSLALYFWNPTLYPVLSPLSISPWESTHFCGPPARILWSHTSVSQLVWLVVFFISYLLPNIILLFKLIYSFFWSLKMSQSILHSFLPFTSYPISHIIFPHTHSSYFHISYSICLLSCSLLKCPDLPASKPFIKWA